MATISEVIQYSQQQVAESVQGSQSFVNELYQAISWVNNWQPVSLGTGITNSNAQMLQFETPVLTINAGTLEDGPEKLMPAQVVSSLNQLTIPTFDEVAPLLNMPATPSAALPDAPTGMPEFIAPSIPIKPDYVLPDLPTFSPVTIPEGQNIELPLWNETAPQDDLLIPTQNFTWSEAPYTSELLDSALALLKDDIDNGGTGINPDDERALWDRARDREMQNADSAMAELQRTMASRGFSVPDGAALSAMQKVQDGARKAISSVGRDIALQRSTLYQQNRQFAVTTGLNAQQFLMSFHAGFAERALNAAKFTFEAGTMLFDMQIKRYNAKLQLYQTVAQVYESQIRSALAKADIYRTQLEAARLTVGINESQVELYKAQLSGIGSAIEIYKSEMEASQINASIEKLKLEAFRERVTVYSEQVRAKSQEFGMYEAAVRGEMAKIDAYKTNVQAYSVRLEASKTQQDIQRQAAEHQIRVGELRINELRANIDRQRQMMQENVENADIALKKHGLDIDVYRTRVDKAVRDATFSLQKWSEETRAGLDLLRTKISEQQAIATSDHQISIEGIQAAKYGVDFYKDIATSAQSSLSAIATLAE